MKMTRHKVVVINKKTGEETMQSKSFYQYDSWISACRYRDSMKEKFSEDEFEIKIVEGN